MEGGNNGNEDPAMPHQVITYQEGPGGPFRRWEPGHQIRPCDCWRTYLYPDRVVLAIDDERRRLAGANRRARIEIQRMRGIVRMQADRIQELQEDILMEQERTNAYREQLQAVNGRLTRVVREVNDRARSIIDECGALLHEVIDTNVPVGGQGDGARREGDAASSAHENESTGSVVD
ncbi:uncharacterized protein [Coffea arabica]|uniref:Uncharacterized protein n=1 Tax=Coffea arabica TaxID=13443 RepID=A0A6P6WGA8_COFAR|nr:uncharacterized protein LOC113732720 [Coffea arabica]